MRGERGPGRSTPPRAAKSYKEIASITGKKIGTVGWLVSKGLKALSSELAPLLGAAPDRDVSGSGLTPIRGEL